MEPRRTGELSLLLRPLRRSRDGEGERKKKGPKTGGDGNQTSTSNSRARLEARTGRWGLGTDCPGKMDSHQLSGLLFNYVGARGLIM